jgi:transcription-repair coupling factor (superfamily II helicase)
VSEGRRYPGMEHWLPLFHERLETLFDYLPGAPLVLEPLADDAARAAGADRDYYEARKEPARRRQAAACPTSRCRRTGSI